MNDETRYAYGAGENACMWHGNIQLAGRKDPAGGDELENRCCPKCKGDLEAVMSESRFWAQMGIAEAAEPGSIAMMRWSQGRCFPDRDTLVNAYRQAMEGQQ